MHPQPIGKSQKILPAIGLLVTTAFSLSLLTEHVIEWTSREEFVKTVSNNRTTIAITVQLVSHALGLLHVYALCSALNLSFRHETGSRSFSLDAARFVNAFYSLRIDKNLSWPLFLTLAGFIGFSFVPASIWAGAITPITFEKHLSLPVEIPSLLNGSNGLSIYKHTADSRGMFSYDMNEFRLPILNGGKDAWSITNGTGSNQKLDKTGFSYLGRSYGVGSSAGLVSIPNTTNPIHYSYHEQGFFADVSCEKNLSATYRMDEVDQSLIHGTPLYMLANAGTFPDGTPTRNITQVGLNPRDVFAWDFLYGDDRSASVVLASSADMADDSYGFAAFNRTQCAATFTPRDFLVDVDNVNKTISVAGVGGDATAWPAYGDGFVGYITQRLQDFAYLDGAFGGSLLGRALRSNFDSLNRTLPEGERRSDDAVLRSVEDFVAYAYDSGIVAMASSLIVIDGSTQLADAEVLVQVIVYGYPTYIYAVFGINVLVCLVYAAEALRTGGWKYASPVDVLDVAGLVVASSRGGGAVAGRFDKLMMDGNEGDARKAQRAVKVQVDGHAPSGWPALILARGLVRRDGR